MFKIIVMKLNFNFFGSLLLLISIMGCMSQGEKKQEGEGASSVTNKLKGFEPPALPAVINNQQDRAEYLIMHYWDKFDFMDTMYCHAPNITDQAFANFINLFLRNDTSAVCGEAQCQCAENCHIGGGFWNA